VILYEAKTCTRISSPSGKNSSSNLFSGRKVACLVDWDTEECIDGYNIVELRMLQQKLDDAIMELIRHDPDQLSLF
jgi:hypothetical protein